MEKGAVEMEGYKIVNDQGQEAWWDGQNVTPINQFTPKQRAEVQQQGQLLLTNPQAAMEQELAHPSPNLSLSDIKEQPPVGSPPPKPTFTPPPVNVSPGQVLEKLNAPVDYLGDVAGRAVQNAIGPTEHPTLSDVGGALTKAVTQYALPGIALKGLGAVANLAGHIVPGVQGGRMEHLISETQNALQSGLSKAQKSEAGFERAFNARGEGRVPLSNTLKTINDMQAREAEHGIQGGVGGDLQRLEDAIRKKSGAPTLNWIDDEMTRVGEKTKAVQGVKPDKAYQQVYGAMVKDLESGQGITLRAKDEAVRRRKGFEDVIDEFNNLVKTKRGQEGATDINANQLIDKLKKKDFLRESLRDEDWKEITPLLSKLADTAALPPARGVRFGSGRAAALGGGAYALGGPAAGGAVAFLDYSVGHLMMTRTGRQLVKSVLEMPGLPSAAKINAINSIGRLAGKALEQGD